MVRRESKRTEIPLVVTNDCPLSRPERRRGARRAALHRHGKTLDDPKRLRYRSDQIFLKSQQEMWRPFGAELPAALTNTLAIADRCNLEIEHGKHQLPVFPLPEGERSAERYLRPTCA